MTASDLKLIDPKRGQKVFLKAMPEPAKSIFCTYLVSIKNLMFHYLRWIEDRLIMEKPDDEERRHLENVKERLLPPYRAWLPTSAEKRWAEKYRLHMDPLPTVESVALDLNAMVNALKALSEDELHDFLNMLALVWQCARDGADDPAWLIEFSGTELIEQNFYHRLVVLVYQRMTGVLDDRQLAEAAFSYAQRPLRRDHFYHTDNSVECFREALKRLNFRMHETVMLIFRDFFDHLEKFSPEARLVFRADAKRNLSPEDFAYVMSTLDNMKIIVDESRAEHPGTAQERFNSLRYVINFEAVLNALRKRSVYGHSFDYAFALVTPMQVFYLAAGKIGAPEDSIFFDFTRLILNPNMDRMVHKLVVERPAFAGTVHIDPLTIN